MKLHELFCVVQRSEPRGWPIIIDLSSNRLLKKDFTTKTQKHKECRSFWFASVPEKAFLVSSFLCGWLCVFHQAA